MVEINSSGGLTHSKKSGTCSLSGVFWCLWLAEPLSIISVSFFVSDCSHTLTPKPKTTKTDRRCRVGQRHSVPGAFVCVCLGMKLFTVRITIISY